MILFRIGWAIWIIMAILTVYVVIASHGSAP